MRCRHNPDGCDACASRVRYSNLKLMALSPAHYRAAVDKRTTAMERGRALHSLVLGGQRVVAYPGKTRRGKEYDAFAADNADAQILCARDFQEVANMAASVLAHPRAMEVLEGEHELEVDWSYLGRTCQSHIDVAGGSWVTELKSAVSSEPGRFQWQAHKMGYVGQVAFYMEALAQVRGVAPAHAYFVAVESAPPHVVTVLEATEAALDMGRRTVRLWMERLLSCEAANDWPGYVQGIVDLDAPAQDIEFTFGEGGDEPPHDPVTGEVAA